ncbi:unnamed protein product [Meloidogyne enterolobii]|uniref:Uncharacterized protein n=1 Tax=Meloidogyne enterolobii TaxID=390850 RepID=A0ACB0YZW8_MELEN
MVGEKEGILNLMQYLLLLRGGNKKNFFLSKKIFSSSKECDKLRFHQFKPSRVCKTDKCATCNRQMTGILMVQGLRCTGCRLIFHKDCANFATKIPCTTPLTSPNPVYKMSEAGRRPWERMSFKSPRLSLASNYHGPLFGAGFTAIPSFNLTKTKQQTDSTALLIESIDDLREFSVFIFKKQSHLGQQNKRETVVDAIFKRALREFHMELIGMEATLQAKF